MKIIDRYISGLILKSFGISLVVFTFILFMGNVIRLLDLFERGVSGNLLLRLFLYFIPYLMTFSIPISLLTAMLLVFGRLSADNEVTAMRACGLGFYAIFKSGFIVAAALTAVCWFVNTSISPRAHYAIRMMKNEVGRRSPEALLEPGIFIDYFKPYQFYIGQKEGKKFKDVIIYESLEDGRTRFLKAASGRIESNSENQIVFRLFNGTMEEPSKEGEATSISGSFKTYIVKMNLEEEEGKLPKRLADCTVSELRARIRRYRRMLRAAGPRLARDLRTRISSLRTEMSERFVFTFCVLAFAMVGMPLGVTAHRGETSIGAAISLALIGLNYAFIICIEAFQAQPEVRPYFLVWVPNIVFVVLGPLLIRRLSKR